MKKLAFYVDEINVHVAFNDNGVIKSVLKEVKDPIKDLPVAVDECLRSSVPNNVITVRGPASFTTVRILMAFGLAFENLSTVSTFDLLKKELGLRDGCVAIDSRRRTFFVKFSNETESELSITDLENIVKEKNLVCISSSPLIPFKTYTDENLALSLLEMDGEDIISPHYFYTPKMKEIK